MPDTHNTLEDRLKSIEARLAALEKGASKKGDNKK